MKYLSQFILLIIAVVLLAGCEAERPPAEIDLSKLNWGMEMNIALEKAETVYNEAVASGLDLSDGPCLTNFLHGNQAYPETVWVLDIAHNPRQEVDNLPANQCEAFRNKQAYNFVELDEAGEVISVYSPFLTKPTQ